MSYDISVNGLAKYALDTFNREEQDLILVEEMEELGKELLKHRRKKPNRAEIVEEFTHVLVSMQVNREILGITDDEIKAEIVKKFQEYGIDMTPEQPVHHEFPNHLCCAGCQDDHEYKQGYVSTRCLQCRRQYLNQESTDDKPDLYTPETRLRCEGCQDNFMRKQGYIGSRCLQCRRQYPGQEAARRKPDLYRPIGTKAP